MDLIQQVGRAQAKTVTLPYRLIDNISSRYSLPIKDNIDYAKRISFLQKDKSEIFESKLSDEIKEMMAGYYRSSGDDIRFRSKSRKDHSFIFLYIKPPHLRAGSPTSTSSCATLPQESSADHRRTGKPSRYGQPDTVGAPAGAIGEGWRKGVGDYA